MWDGFNQRKFPRLAARCRVRLYPLRSKNSFTTQTRNVGMGGVCVCLPKPLGKMMPCRLVLHLNKKDKALECEGHVAWCVGTQPSPRTRKKVYDIGIEFMTCPPEMAQRLRIFLQHQPRGALAAE